MLNHGTSNCSASPRQVSRLPIISRGVGLDLAVANRPQQGERRLGPVRDANRQRGRRPVISGDQVRIESLVRCDIAAIAWRSSSNRDGSMSMRVSIEKTLSSIVVVHLDFGDVRAHPGHGMNDRVGQPAVIGTDGGDYDLHDERSRASWSWICRKSDGRPSV